MIVLACFSFFFFYLFIYSSFFLDPSKTVCFFFNFLSLNLLLSFASRCSMLCMHANLYRRLTLSVLNNDIPCENYREQYIVVKTGSFICTFETAISFFFLSLIFFFIFINFVSFNFQIMMFENLIETLSNSSICFGIFRWEFAFHRHCESRFAASFLSGGSIVEDLTFFFFFLFFFSKKSNVSRGIIQLHAHVRHCFVNPLANLLLFLTKFTSSRENCCVLILC